MKIADKKCPICGGQFSTARRKFRLGDVVVPTRENICRLRPKPPRQGVVVGFSKSPLLVKVRRDGFKTVSSYWHGFWKRMTSTVPNKTTCKSCGGTGLVSGR